MEGLQPSEKRAAGQSDRTLLERARLRPPEPRPRACGRVQGVCTRDTASFFCEKINAALWETGQVRGGREYFSNAKIRRKKNH